jgi:hypothetical protein
MNSLKLTESQLEQLIKLIVSEGALEDWNYEMDFESKMIQSMIKEKLKEIQKLKNKANDNEKLKPVLNIDIEDENIVGTLTFYNPEIGKKMQTKFNYGNIQWFEGPNDPDIREYAENKAYNYLKNKFPSEYA